MNKRYISVSGLNKYLKDKIDKDLQLQHFYIKGEISNVKRHSSGHIYFTLKDDLSRVNAVMFKSNVQNMVFDLNHGDKVLVEASLSVYDVAGTFQLYVSSIELDGIGNLFLQYENLKNKLQSEGLFDQQHKKKLVAFPTKIAILTAYPSAALMDILKTLKSRYPVVRVVVFPIPVQGKDAYKRIITTLQEVDQYRFSTIIIARGGGSLEDLWNFNEEALARCIYSCQTPIVSAIGHEVDYTICDFVSDYRAITPTDAANITTPSIIELKDKLNLLENRLNEAMNGYILNKKNQYHQISNHYLLNNPSKLFEQQMNSLALKQTKFISSYEHYLNGLQQNLNVSKMKFKHLSFLQFSKNKALIKNQEQQLIHQFKFVLMQQSNQLELTMSKLDNLSPLKIMQRGYSIVYQDENLISSKNDLQKGDEIKIKFVDGHHEAIIK